MNTVTVKKIEPKGFDKGEILRYLRCKEADEATTLLLHSCIKEVEGNLSQNVCFAVFSLNIDRDYCDFGDFFVRSYDLAKNLSGCDKVLLFAATLGTYIDRLITKYSKISPSRALMLQAIGAERAEALCDAFCDSFAKENGVILKPRFSPGYGDLPLNTQREIFKFLDCQRKIALTLNDSLLMSPSKSVTAFVGIRS